MMDSARDLSQAKDIADGLAFPLLGPDIGGFAHVGPIWFYFLAIPALTGSLIVMAIWIGFFSSLKIVLAYHLGNKLLGNKFGILFASMLFLPGWQSIDNMVLMHTNVVQALTMAFLFIFHQCLSEGKSQNIKWLLLILSLAIHAHPSTIILTAFIVYLVFKKWNDLKIYDLLLGVILFLLPFVPYLYDQISNGFLDFQRLSNKAASSEKLNPLQRLPNFIISLFYYGPLQIRNFICEWNVIIGNSVFAIYIITCITSVAGYIKYIIKSKQNLIHFIWGSVVFILLCLMVLVLRSFIPFYMMLVLAPFILGGIAFGIFQIMVKKKLITIQLYCLILFFINIFPMLALTKQANNQQFVLPNVSNIEIPAKFNKFDLTKSLDGISIINTTHIQNLLCDDIYVHGPFSIVLDYTSAIPVSFSCPQQNISLSGTQNSAEKHVFIMHKSFWDSTDIKPEGWLYPGLGFTTEFTNHSHSNAWQLAPFDAYKHPQRKGIEKKSKSIFEYTFSTHANSIIAMTNTLPFYISMNIESIEINNGELQPIKLINNTGNWLYQCENCLDQRKINWNIKISSEEKYAIDINEIYQ